MPIDPNIALQVRPVEFADPMQQYGRAIQLRSLIGQGDLQALQIEQARREAADNERFRAAMPGAVETLPEGGFRIRDFASLSAASPTRALELQGKALEGDAKRAEIRKNTAQAGNYETDAFNKRRNVHLGNLSAVDTPEAFLAWVDEGARRGALSDGEAAFYRLKVERNPNVLETLRQRIYEGSMSADARASFRAPKPVEQSDGQTRFFVDNNPFSQTFGQRVGAPAVQMQPTPGEVMTDRRTREEGAANRSVTLRGQNMTDARARELAAATREAAATGRIPSGYQRSADGTGLEFIPGGPADPARERNSPPTEDERKAAGWLDQATNAYKNMLGVLGANPNAAKPAGGVRSAAGTLVQSLPIIGQTDIAQGIGNFIKPADRLQFEQATGSMSEALLRAATGAGVNRDEARQKVREITPVFGDDDATIKQKLDSIPVYLESLKTRAGRAVPKDYAVPGAGAAATGGAPAGPKPGAVEGGYVFNGGDPSSPANWRKVGGGK